MPKLTTFAVCLALTICLFLPASSAYALLLDGDGLTVGTYTDSPLQISTAAGNVYFTGEVRSRSSDDEVIAAGSTGEDFDITVTDEGAWFDFDFDVSSVQFIYGGNLGGIIVEARDSAGGVVDSFTQADTFQGQAAGPAALSGDGIRTLFWTDTRESMYYCELDNVSVTPSGSRPVPEPASMALLGLAMGGIGVTLKKRRRK